MKYVKLNGQMIQVPEEAICVEESCDYFVWNDKVFHKDDVLDEEDFQKP
jgi:hypothetical protein